MQLNGAATTPIEGVWVRPMRPEDMPTLKEWAEAQRGKTPFNMDLSTGAQILVVYDADGIQAFVPFQVALTLGCPLRKDAQRGWGDDHQADGFAAVLRTLRFIADAQGVREINAACWDDDTAAELVGHGFVGCGTFLRQRR